MSWVRVSQGLGAAPGAEAEIGVDGALIGGVEVWKNGEGRWDA